MNAQESAQSVKRAQRLAAATVTFALLLALTGCGGNDDPRRGEVVINKSNCLFGDCWHLTKICRGTTLVTRFSDGYSADDWTEESPNDPECLRLPRTQSSGGSA